VLTAVFEKVQQDLGDRLHGIALVNIPTASPTLTLTEEFYKQKAANVVLEKFQPSPYIPLSADFETYLAGIDKKQRHEIRRKIRRAEESDRGVRWYFVESVPELERGIDTFFSLMEADPGKQVFLTTKMRQQMAAIAQTAMAAGTLKFAFLEIDGEVAASYLNFDYNNKIWVYNSGYDRKFNDLSAGWVLLGYLIEWASNNGRTEFDFMRGDEDYKFKFGGIDRPVLKLTVTF
jgi:CelD/BcsL family acetyltransferase involved in cellulose biosynthesis